MEPAGRPVLENPQSTTDNVIAREPGRMAGLPSDRALGKVDGPFDRMALPRAVARRYSHQISGG